MSEQEDAWHKIFTRLFGNVVEVVENHVDEDVKKDLYLDLVDIMEEYNEGGLKDLMAISISLDEALLEKHPDLFKEYIEDITEEDF